MAWRPSREPDRYDRARVARLAPIRAAADALALPLRRKRKLAGVMGAIEMQIEDGGDSPQVNALLLDALRAGVRHQAGERASQAVLRAIDAFTAALVAAFAFVRVVAVREGLPGPDQWLVLRRSLGERGQLKTYLSNAPAATAHATLVRKSGMRWPVEATILECKSELGMDHYEVRSWRGWHHHMTMTLLAHHFLVRQRCLLGGKIGRIDGAASAAPIASYPAQTAA